jgi:phosphoglycerol transferase MdoB-like AlkP superfamily enzyme
LKNTHKLFIITFAFLLIICACTKKKNDTSLQTDSYTESTQNSQNNLTIDIKELETLVKHAKTLNTQVVMAITILHHNELKDLENKMFDHDINAYEKEKLFESRKNAFFNKLQFSYDDYVAYITEHSDEINEYIISHPEITDYLATENRGEK